MVVYMDRRWVSVALLLPFSTASMASGMEEVFQRAEDQHAKGKEIAYAIVQPMHVDKLGVLTQCQLERRFADEMEARDRDAVSAIAADTAKAECDEITDRIVGASHWQPPQ